LRCHAATLHCFISAAAELPPANHEKYKKQRRKGKAILYVFIVKPTNGALKCFAANAPSLVRKKNRKGSFAAVISKP
jgi:hypothetical protein